MNDTDLDTLLTIIGNPTRRQILRKLVKETHYPLQLSRELSVSQQSIMKHLKVLEENDLVTSVFRKSDAGPPRKFYVATKSLTIVIDLSPGLFHEELRFHDAGSGVIRAEADTRALSNAKNLRMKLGEFMGTLNHINDELAELGHRRDELLARKDEILRHANHIVDTLCEDYEQRKVLRYILNDNEFSLAVMAERLNMRETEVERVMKNLEKQGILMLSRGLI